MVKRGLGVLVAAAVVITGCGGSGGETPGAAAGSAAADYESPLAAFLGMEASTDEDAMAEQVAEQERAVGEYITRCMAEQGFTYVHPDEASMVIGSAEGEPEYGSEDWVAEYGFGITTQRYPQEQIGADLKGFDDRPDTELEDPNETYIESLSDAERDAYYAALYGTDMGPALDESMTEEEQQAAIEEHARTVEPSGCMNEAYAEVDLFGGSSEFFDEWGDEIEALYERIEADPRVVAWREEAERCVVEAGYAYHSMEDLYPYFEDRLVPIDDRFSEEGPEPPPRFAEMDADEQDRWYRENQPTLDDEGRALLAELQAEELEMAAAYHECGASELDAPVYYEVAAELEQRFLDEHADELAPYKG